MRVGVYLNSSKITHNFKEWILMKILENAEIGPRNR